MDNWLIIFVGVTAAAVVIQAIVLTATYLRLRRIDNEMGELRQRFNDRVDPLLDRLDDILRTFQGSWHRILGDLAAISGTARAQVEKFDRLTDDVADRARGEIIRLDEVLARAITTVETTGEKIEQSLATPVREVAAVVAGIKTALAVLGERRRAGRARPDTLPEAMADEELFI
jgi:hypothetical protein